MVANHFSRAFGEFDPDLVISVHPLMQHVPLRVLQRRQEQQKELKQPPFATVVTDLTSCHPTWFHKGVTACFVPTQQARQLDPLAPWGPPPILDGGLPWVRRGVPSCACYR